MGVFRMLLCEYMQQQSSIIHLRKRRVLFFMFCTPHAYIHRPVLRVVGKGKKSRDRDKKRNIKERGSCCLMINQFCSDSALLFLEAMFSCSPAWHTVKDWLHYTLNSLESLTSSKKYDVLLDGLVYQGETQLKHLKFWNSLYNCKSISSNRKLQ